MECSVSIFIFFVRNIDLNQQHTAQDNRNEDIRKCSVIIKKIRKRVINRLIGSRKRELLLISDKKLIKRFSLSSIR